MSESDTSKEVEAADAFANEAMRLLVENGHALGADDRALLFNVFAQHVKTRVAAVEKERDEVVEVARKFENSVSYDHGYQDGPACSYCHADPLHHAHGCAVRVFRNRLAAVLRGRT